MADEIDVKLGGDNARFRAMLEKSIQDAEKFGGELGKRVSGKLSGMRDISNALATALGINLTSIGENIARVFTGMTKEVENAYKQLDAVGTQVADLNIKNMRAMLTEEQIYTLNLRERDKLQRQISDTIATTAPQQLAMKQAELKLGQVHAEILAHEKKLREEIAKQSEEAAKKQFATAEKTSQTQIDILGSDEKIAALKFNIAATEAAIASGLLSRSETERFSATLAERKNDLVKEEAKVRGAAESDEAKHAERMIEARQKEIDDKRELMTFNQQMAALRQDEQGWLTLLSEKGLEAKDRQVFEYELAKVREKMRDTELGKKKEDVELARLLLVPTEELTAQEKLRLEVLTGAKTQREVDLERTQLIAGMVAGTLTPAEKERLAVLLDQKVVLDEQLATAQAITTTVSRTGKGYDQQSDDSIEGVRNRLKQQIDQIKRDDFGRGGGVGGKGKPAELYLLENELFNLEKEINSRNEVRNYASQFGESKTRQKFGDTATDKAFRDFNDNGAATRVAVEDLATRMKKLFPDP